MTTLTELLTKHLSDKVSAHSYGPVYDEILSPYRDSATAILELGVMHGQSLKAWRDYFPNAEIWGVDNDWSRLDKALTETSFHPVHVDTTDRDRFIEATMKMPDFDIIIDDASHVITEQVWALAVLWSKLKPGGIYVVEDILYPQYLRLFECFQNTKIYDLRHVRGQHDDMMAVVRKISS